MKAQTADVLHRLYYGFSALLAMLLILMATGFLSFQQMQKANDWSIHTYQVLVETHAMGEALINMDTGARGFAITGEERFLQPLTTGHGAFLHHWSTAKQLTTDNPHQQERLQQLGEKYRQWNNTYLEPLQAIRRATPDRQTTPDRVAHITAGKHYTDAMRALLQDINDTESRLLRQRTHRAARLQTWTQSALLAGGVFAILLGIILSALLVTNTRRLSHVNEALEEEITERRQAEAAARFAVREAGQAKTEAEQAKAEAECAKAEAEQANHAKSEFLSRMSHELRTPLNAILGFGQLLEMDGLDDTQRQGVGQILKGGRHLLDLINEVLDIARIEAGQMQLSPEPVQAGELLEESLALVSPLASARHIGVDSLSGERAEAGTSYVLADRQRLKQVLLNLLGNAIKYNREGGRVTVAYELIELSPEQAAERNGVGDWLHIQVSDTGPGIPAEKMERLFVPFDRLGAEQTRVEGTGLGLTLSRRLIEAMGGVMGVTSIVGEGSTFWFELPLTESPIARHEPRDEQTRTLETEHPAHTVLYIEDNLSNLQLIERLLQQRSGIKLLSAMQGSIGVELARQHQPDLILLDLHLPDISGHDVLQRLRAEPVTREIPVVVLSADATPGQVQRLLSSGAHAYLTKPLDVRQFLQILDESLDFSPASKL